METAEMARGTTEFAAAVAAEEWSAGAAPDRLAAVPLAGLAWCHWPELSDDAQRDGSASEGQLANATVPLRVVLGRVRRIQDRVTPPVVGHVVVLDEHSTALVEIQHHGRVVARGNLRSLDGRYCVQITELVRAPDPVGGPVRSQLNAGSTP